MARFSELLLVLAVLGSCIHSKGKQVEVAPPPPALTPLLDIRSFSETQPVTALAVQGSSLYVGTPTGLVRFDLRDGRHATREKGFAGDQVRALAASSRSGLWVATEAGLSRLQDGVWTVMQKTHPHLEAVTTMVATDSGLWAGGPHGIARWENDSWTGFLPGAPVTHLLRDLRGDGVWVGTSGEGVYQFQNGAFVSHSPAHGQMVRRVSGMTFSAEGGLFVVGSSDKGDRLTFFDGTFWTSYAFDTGGVLRWVEQVGGRTLVSYDDHILVLERAGMPGGPGRAPPPAGHFRTSATPSAKAPPGYPVPEFRARPFEHWAPPVPTRILGHEQRIIMGTQSAGTVVFDGTNAHWFRTTDLVGDTVRLKVACAGSACYFAGGDGQAYRFDGQAFTPVRVPGDVPSRTLAFVQEPGGGVLALTTAASDGQTLAVSRLSGAQFAKLHEVKVTIPGGRVEVRFARYDPQGRLWLGLDYRDSDPESHPWGVAVMSEGAPLVYHRSTMTPVEDRVAGSLALPDEIRDVGFVGEDTWAATSAGLFRVRGQKVDQFTENDGLESELVYAVVRSGRGELVVGTHGGVGVFDGKWWRFEQTGPLKTATRAFLLDGAALWVGTSAGVVQWEGTRTRVIDANRGVAGNTVLDLFLDNQRRLWILTDQGLSILRPGGG